MEDLLRLGILHGAPHLYTTATIQIAPAVCILPHVQACSVTIITILLDSIHRPIVDDGPIMVVLMALVTALRIRILTVGGSILQIR